MIWETPEVLHPLVSSPHEAKVSVGVNGELLDEPVAEERGYIVEKRNSTFRIAIPYNTEGGYRKVRRQESCCLYPAVPTQSDTVNLMF